MQFIPTRVHGILDYVVGIALIAAPWLFGFAEGGAETWVPVILGAGTIIYSLMTDYELGVAKVISMPTHLMIDGIAGAFLAVSPWLLGYADIVWVPHVLVGLIEIGAAIFTSRTPEGRTAGSTTTTSSGTSTSGAGTRTGRV